VATTGLTCPSPNDIVSAVIHAGLRRLLRVAAVFGLAGLAAAQTPLPANSPFLPGGSVSPPAAATPGGLEFVAVLTEGKKTSVSLYDSVTKKSHWIPVRGEADGIAVLSYDAVHNQVVVRTGGTEKRLTLRREKNTVAGAHANGVPTPSSNVATPAVVSATSIAPTVKPPGPTPPPPVVKEQEEARLLVSDLLEIGLAQRKAHEEMQKKAAPAPAPPAKPSGG